MAIETEDYVHAAGTFAGVDPPPAPIPADGVVGQQGIRNFTRNGLGDYTLELEERIGFREALVRVVPGLNQLVVIGGQVDFANTRLVQVRCYNTLGAPADCQIFSVQVLQVAVGPVGQLPLAAPPAPIVASAAPSFWVFGANSVTATTVDRFLFPSYSDSQAMNTAIRVQLPRAGTLRSLTVSQTVGAGNGSDIVYTVRLDQVATALAVALASTLSGSVRLAADVAFAQDQEIDLFVEKAVSVGTGPSDVSAIVEYS